MTAASGRMHAKQLTRCRSAAHAATVNPTRRSPGAPFRSDIRAPRPIPGSTPLRDRTWSIRAEADQGSDGGATAASPAVPRDQEPEDARAAIALGLRLHEAGQYNEALGVFQKALELPGTGIKRFRDKPSEVSDSERISALYNIACCFSALDQQMSGLRALAAALEAGYTNFAQIKSDPDLETVRKHPKFDGLLARFDKSGGFFAPIMNGFRR